MLFIGSIYLLLGTNLGARLGFLVTFTSLMGFLMILSILWLTTASPLESPKGRVASWSVIENVPDITKAKTEAVRDIAQKQNKASQIDASNVLASVDAALITKVGTPTVQVTPNDNRFAKFDDVTQVHGAPDLHARWERAAVLEGRVQPLEEVRRHRVLRDGRPGAADVRASPVAARMRERRRRERGFVVATFDYGTLRLPPFVVIVITAILFGLGLLALHWREKDEMARKQAEAGPAAVPARDDSELTKV